jgi:hypothetical protein
MKYFSNKKLRGIDEQQIHCSSPLLLPTIELFNSISGKVSPVFGINPLTKFTASQTLPFLLCKYNWPYKSSHLRTEI